MSTHLGNTDAPLAARSARPGWRDPRLWIGVALVAVSVLVGARLLGGADDTIEVWTARADLAPGQQVEEGDLVARRVQFNGDDADHYLRSDKGVPERSTLNRAVGAGELLPRAALGDDDDIRPVPLSVPPEIPTGFVRRGMTVDVFLTQLDTGDPKVEPNSEQLLDDVIVIDAPPIDEGLGSSGNRQLLIGVDDDISNAELQRLVGAARAGRIYIIGT